MTRIPTRFEIESILRRKETQARKAKDEYEERSLEYTTLRSAIEMLGFPEASTELLAESNKSP